MNDDWRLQIDPRAPTEAGSVIGRLEALPSEWAEAREVEHELSTDLHDTVIVSRDDARVFLYAGTRAQAEAARRLLERLAKEHGWKLDIDFKHWHPEAEAWEDPDEPLPTDAASKAAEHAVRIATERREVAETGRCEFEVRADLKSRHEAIKFAEKLRAEGLPAVQRWRFLLVGATDEDAAAALANRIRAEAPAGSHVYAEGTWQTAYHEYPASPFWFLGGLADG
ncbi:MAG TPA: hypothetical protein VF731_02410 [Solirubrobacterales bacterium]